MNKISNKKVKVLVAGYNSSFHDEYSGYGRIMEYSEGALVYDFTKTFNDDKYTFFDAIYRRVIVELSIIMRGITVDLVHYIYPEGMVFISPLILKMLNKKIVMTLHLSPEWFAKKHCEDSIIKRLIRKLFNNLTVKCISLSDCGISLAKNKINEYRRSYKLGDVRHIPHGVVISDIEPNNKSELIQKKLSICVVGKNYRNWDFINAILNDIRSANYKFHLIGVDFSKVHFPDSTDVVEHIQRLNHEAYSEVLADSLFMLLPLHYATANNAILEAYQNNLFVLTTKEGANEYYIENSVLLMKTPEDFFEIIEKTLDEANRRSIDIDSILNNARKSSNKKYGWPSIARQLQGVYHSLVK